MTTDIFRNSAVDLVIFTVADQASLPSQLWDDSLVSYGRYRQKFNEGLSLFVLTVPANADLYPNLEGKRVLPGGFLEADERLIQASQRIAYEQLGIDKRTRMRQIGTFDDPYRDPNRRIISFSYWAMVNFEDIRKYLGGREQIGLELVNSQYYMDRFAEEVGPLEDFDGVCRFGNRVMPSPSSFRGHRRTLTKDLPEGQILGLDHDDMVFYAWRKLRHAFESKLDPFRSLGLNPLGMEFRLSDLQEFREVCRGERIQRDQFRRQLLSTDSFILNTGRVDRSKPGKPANLYRPVNLELPGDEEIDPK